MGIKEFQLVLSGSWAFPSELSYFLFFSVAAEEEVCVATQSQTFPSHCNIYVITKSLLNDFCFMENMAC